MQIVPCNIELAHLYLCYKLLTRIPKGTIASRVVLDVIGTLCSVCIGTMHGCAVTKETSYRMGIFMSVAFSPSMFHL